MATAAATTLPLATADADPSGAAPIDEERQSLTLTSDHPSTTSQPDKSESPPPPVPKSGPLFINSITDLKDLSDAIASFHKCYEDLHKHLNCIKAAIAAKLPSETTNTTTISHASESAPNPNLSDTSPTTERPNSSPKPNVSDGTVLNEDHESNPPYTELEGHCRLMCSRGVRKYVISHLSNPTQLREEVPKALKLAAKPPKLVLECMGKFYLQGSKLFARNSSMIPGREASLLILECFLLLTGQENLVWNISKPLKVEAHEAALAWRKRIMAEGELVHTNQTDARGLLMFVACFGIPNTLKRDDIVDLVVAANAKGIASLLRMSTVLMKKISEIVDRLLRRNREVKAVDLIYTFGLEDEYDPENILVSCLQESREAWKNPLRTGSQTPAAALHQANKKHLSTLRSIRKCLQRHNIDIELLPIPQMNDEISSLEKDVANCEKMEEQWTKKRKPGENEPTLRNPKSYEPKRPCYAPGPGPQHHGADTRTNNTSYYHNNNNNMYPSSTPVVYGGPGAGLLPEGMAQPHSAVNYAAGVVVHGHGGADPYMYGGQPPAAGGGLYGGPAPVVGGFADGLPNTGRATDLYQFAESVPPYVGGGSQVGGGGGGGGGGPTYQAPPYLYKS